jgi:hypothetical protein
MLIIPLEKLAYIIIKAREFDADVPTVDDDSGSNPSDDAEWDVLESGSDNPAHQELVDALNSLTDPERIEVLALTWLGRGDYGKEDWREVLEEAAFTTRRRPNTWWVRHCWPIIWKKGSRNSVTQSRISRSAGCRRNPWRSGLRWDARHSSNDGRP